ncbi:MAG: leucine-rich repeat protein [Erysipelotrichaceae bacterium]|nr:leucine-rich repeat protein [Erysipelotrichaceae bacterium]
MILYSGKIFGKTIVAMLVFLMLVVNCVVVRAEDDAAGDNAEETNTEEVIAEETNSSEGVNYVLNEDGTLVISGSGPCDIVFGDVIENHNLITKAVISEGITAIGKKMLYGLGSLQEVEIADTVETIDELAFGYCTSLSHLYLPASIKDVNASSFDTSPFFECMDSLLIYTAASDNIFGNYWLACNRAGTLLDVIYCCTPVDYRYWSTIDKNVENLVIPEGITIVPDYCFYKNKTLKHVAFPSTMDRICDYAFFECENLEEINLPDTLSYLGDWSFYSCMKAEGTLVIPEGLKVINQKAFTNDENLDRVILSSSLEEIAFYAFEDCHGLREVVVPRDSKLRKISDKAFRECGLLRYFYIPESVERIIATSDVFAPFSADRKLILLLEGSEKKEGYDTLWHYGTAGVEYNVSYERYEELLASSFTMSFDGNGETAGDYDDIDYVYAGVAYPLPACPFEKDGYSFKGWSLTSDGSGTIYTPGSKLTIDKRPEEGNATVYAIWSAKKFKITYVNNGGTANKNPKSVSADSVIELKNLTPRKGYVFTGWYLDIECQNKTEIVENISDNLVLYAGMQKATNTISFQIIDPKECTVPDDLVYEYNDKGNVELPNVYSADGTKIVWYRKDPNGRLSRITSIKNNSLKDYELVGQWVSETYNISYILNGAKNNQANKKTYMPSQGFDLAVPIVPKGATFLYWQDQYGNIIESTNDLHYDLILTAVLEYEEFTVNVDLEGGYYKVEIDERWNDTETGVSCTISIPLGAPKLLKPIRDGYIFKGYYNKDTNRTVSSIAKPYKNLDLGCRWAIGKYTVSYNLNGGSLPINTSLKTKTYLTSDDPSITDVVPNKKGYRFVGWTLKKNGEEIFEQTSLYNLYNELGTTKIVFYAKWEPITYTVTFKAEGMDDIVRTYNGNEKVVFDGDIFKRDDYSAVEFTYVNSAGKNTVVKANASLSYVCLNDGGNVDVFVNKDAEGKEKWKLKKYDIVYDIHPGQLEYAGPVLPKSYYYSPLSCVVKVSNPIKEGYSFIGWAYFDNNGIMRFIRPVGGDGSSNGYCYLPKAVAKNLFLFRLFRYEMDF